MIVGMDHTGFVVKDIDKSVAFYKEVIGLEVAREIEREGDAPSQLLGYDDMHYKAALLNMGGGHKLELIQYMNPEPTDRPTEERNVLGASHLAFMVDDMQATFERILSGGGQKLNAPVEVAPSRVCCYLQDPDGNWIELIEDPNQ